MKSKIIILAILCYTLISGAYAQNIPNGGFENWENRILYEEPVSWNTGNMEVFRINAITAFDTIDSYSGVHALRLETVVSQEDTLAGYAFCNGTINGGGVSDTLLFQGGFPVSGAPDSLFGHFKYQMAENDTGIVLISFKSGGNIIGQNIFSLIGAQNSYAKLGWEINAMAGTPDTAMIAFACSNPDKPQPGGWLQVDSIWFGGIGDSIPNADFEFWEAASYQEPEHWVTANLFSYLFGGDTCATPTTDAHSGDYAIRIESIQAMIPSDSGFNAAVVGFAVPYSTSYNFSPTLPTFNVDFNPAQLTGYYKFEPLLNDTALVYGYLTDDEEHTYPFVSILLPTDEYLPFEIPLNYPDGVTITMASFLFSTSLYFMQGDGRSGEIGSILYVDDLNLVNPCDAYPPYSIAGVNLPLCGENIAVIDAGDGWAEYLWSTGATTQTISVPVTEPTNYSVTVTAAVSGCQFSDEVTVSLPLCDAIEETAEKTMEVGLYPNPSTGDFTLEFYNALPGEYTAEIVAITGKVLFKETLFISKMNKIVKFSLSDYPEGLYLVKISGEKFSYCESMMINR
jgi:hypothetical protein